MAIKKRGNRSNVIVTNIEAHVNSFYKRINNAVGFINPKGHGYFIHGKMVTAEEFNEVFPVESLQPNINQFGESLDKTKIPK